MAADLPTERLRALAEAADRLPDWPAGSWAALRAAGVLRWSVPAEFGGAGLGPADMLRGNEALAGACLTTTFILSQREAAVRRLLAGPAHLKARFLPRAAAGEAFLTVGLSQLTTSRQHRAPALVADRLPGGGYRLTGEVPWVTGADQAAGVVIGATLATGEQVLLVLPAGHPRASVGPPMPLAALAGSRTAAVRCDGVDLGPEWVLGEPGSQVLGTVGGGGLETSALALGVAGAAVDLLTAEAGGRPDLAGLAAKFEAARAAARGRLHAAAGGQPGPAETLGVRVECTGLALRATQAALAVAKGAGFVAPHPAQRLARQAMFFLVWSCPRPVADGVLAALLPPG